MTILRPQDANLHDEHGDHIDPGTDRALKARLARHLEAHELPGKSEEMAAAALELREAREATAAAKAREAQVLAYAIAVARQEVARRGATRAQVAKMLGMHERTLRDYFKQGYVRRRQQQ